MIVGEQRRIPNMEFDLSKKSVEHLKLEKIDFRFIQQFYSIRKCQIEV